MSCDLCGSNTGPFYKGDVEGVQMTMCGQCKGAGTDVHLITKPRAPKTESKTQNNARLEAPARKEIIQIISPNYAQKIKSARERMGLKQEDFAKRIAEKTSIIHSLESGRHMPNIDLARKLERELGITLVEQHEEQSMVSGKDVSGPITIADLIKPKK